jgi:hypothetical protein
MERRAINRAATEGIETALQAEFFGRNREVWHSGNYFERVLRGVKLGGPPPR